MTTTIDELIGKLQAQRANGVPGETVVVISALDNNSKGGMMKLDSQLYVGAIARDEYAKGWTLCRSVSRGGVPVLVIG